MALYDRIIGRDDEGRVVQDRINPEVLAAVMYEFGTDVLSASQARSVFSGFGYHFSDDEEDEIADLYQTIAQQATPIAKHARLEEIKVVLFLARLQAVGYSRPTYVKARLGV